MIHELRIYRCMPGRLPDLNKRFESATLKIWEKHGFRPVGFWTTVIGESNQDLTYLLAWESLADRDKKWAAFQADPEWISKRAETEKDGAIVQNVSNQLLVPTAFSPSPILGVHSGRGCFRRCCRRANREATTKTF